MRRILALGLALAGLTSFARSLAAQERHLDMSLFVASNSPLQNLSDFPNMGFKTGFGGGVGATYSLDQNFALRAEGAFLKSDINVVDNIGPIPGTGAGSLQSTSWTRILVGGDLMVRFPVRNVTPYFTTGAGMERFMESGGRKATRVAGRFGGGVRLDLKEGLGVFAQANAQVFNFDQRFFEFFDKVQVDMLLSAGVSMRVL